MAIDIGVRNVVDILANHPFLLAGAFVLYIVFFLVAVFFHGRKPGRNPFCTDFRRPREPYVHEPKARDAVLKQRFKATKVPENLDVIIIGSGISGLTAAVLLGRAGKKVLVLEQHDQVGGCCHTFVEKGFEFDTGIHYIGSMHDGSMNRTLLDQITCGQLQWARMDDAFDTVVLGKGTESKCFPMTCGTEKYVQNLVNFFPDEEKAIKKYIELVLDANNSFMGYVLLKALPRRLVNFLVSTGLYWCVCACYRKGYVKQTLQEVLDSLTDNAQLKVVLSYICGDYGMAPEDVPFALHAILIKHYMAGAYYPIAGPSEIGYQIVQSIQKHGGRVLVQAPVEGIVCDTKGRAMGVKVGGKHNLELHAKHIISACGAYNTFKRLLPEKVAKTSCIYPIVESVGPSVSFLTAFFGVEGSVKELNLPAGNFWIYNTLDINQTMKSFMTTDKEDMEEAAIPFGYISFPGAKDPEWEKKYPDKSSVLVITLAKWEWFEEWQNDKVRGRGDRYEGIKDKLGRQLWEMCVDQFPQLDGKCVYTEVGTPVTNQFYLGCAVGEMYGLNQGAARFSPEVASKLRADTDIKGLYLTGQDTMTCGFTSALMSAVLTCSVILHRNVYGDLEKLNKKEKEEYRKVTVNGESKKTN